MSVLFFYIVFFILNATNIVLFQTDATKMVFFLSKGLAHDLFCHAHGSNGLAHDMFCQFHGSKGLAHDLFCQFRGSGWSCLWPILPKSLGLRSCAWPVLAKSWDFSLAHVRFWRNRESSGLAHDSFCRNHGILVLRMTCFFEIMALGSCACQVFHKIHRINGLIVSFVKCGTLFDLPNLLINPILWTVISDTERWQASAARRNGKPPVATLVASWQHRRALTHPGNLKN